MNTQKIYFKIIFVFIFLFASITSYAQQSSDNSQSLKEPTAQTVEKKWYDQISLRGYVQVRYNRLFETNENLVNEQGDKSLGKNQSFFIRRARLIFSGQIHRQIYFYLQPDLASSPSSDKLYFAQLRDAYFDLGVDPENEFRFRVGQSKIPYGFENLQSSQNRLALDRNDALNSAFSNERDLGVFFYWTPKAKRDLLNDLVRSGLKGSGNYGIFALGAFNGQTANSPEKNNELHVVSRLTYPFQYKNQIVEAGVQAYTGHYVVSNVSQGVKYRKDLNYLDQRIAASFILYPKPFGLQVEYNIGKGPEFNKQTDSIEVKKLHGGYVQAMYKLNMKKQVLIPFVKYQYYKGGKKHELDARSYEVKDWEIGLEWQPVKYFELVADYTISRRRYEDFKNQNNFQQGNMLRLQAQLNF